MDDKARENLPPPNLQGDYHGSCVVCLRGTDTALAFTGDAGWLVAGLMMLGVPIDAAPLMVEKFFAENGADPEMVLDGEHTMASRVCAECVSKSRADFPAPGIPTFGVPDIRGPAPR